MSMQILGIMPYIELTKAKKKKKKKKKKLKKKGGWPK
jgi:hypothetical protein